MECMQPLASLLCIAFFSFFFLLDFFLLFLAAHGIFSSPTRDET